MCAKVITFILVIAVCHSNRECMKPETQFKYSTIIGNSRNAASKYLHKYSGNLLALKDILMWHINSSHLDMFKTSTQTSIPYHAILPHISVLCLLLISVNT